MFRRVLFVKRSRVAVLGQALGGGRERLLQEIVKIFPLDAMVAFQVGFSAREVNSALNGPARTQTFYSAN